jgi:hypothetical protein
MAYGGINRVVAAGSFDATFSLKNIRFNENYTWHDLSVGFKDKLSRTWFFVMSRRSMSMRLKDTEAPSQTGRPGDFGSDRSELLASFGQPPDSVKLRFIYDEKSGRCRFLYGINGAEAVSEPSISREGMHLAKPFSESNAAYILLSLGTAEADHFEIRPL